MKAIFRLFVFILLLGGWTLAGLSLHVIRTPQQIPITLLTKNKLGFTDTWVDTTKWTLADVSKHPVVVERIIRMHQADVLKHLADPKKGQIEDQLTDALSRADQHEPAASSPSIEQFARRWIRWPWEG